MKTIIELPVIIDFDDASLCWKSNKKYCGNGTYKYVCQQTMKSGQKCGKICWKENMNCYVHRNKLTN